jgi:predicted FMN-binding regulatory protein PaiB
MYRPTAFEEDRPAVLHAIMHAHPLAQLVTHGPDGLDRLLARANTWSTCCRSPATRTAC